MNPYQLIGGINPIAGIDQEDLLPVQSAMPPAQLDPQEEAGPGDGLPYSPSGRTSDLLAGTSSSAMPVPSGLPSQEELALAALHRGLGNSTADAVANSQGIINILRPGSGNVSVGNSSRELGNSLAQQVLAAPMLKRQEALQNQQLNDISAMRRQQLGAIMESNRQTKARRSLDSDETRQTREEGISILSQLRASAPPAIQGAIDERIKKMSMMNAEQIDRAMKSDPLMKQLELEASKGKSDAQSAQSSAALEETIRNHKAMEGLARDKALKPTASDLKLIGQQEKIVSSIADLIQFNKYNDQLMGMLPKGGGDLDTGLVKNKLEAGKAIVPTSLVNAGIAFGFPGATALKPDEKYTDFQAILAPMQTARRRAVDGTVRFNKDIAKSLEGMVAEPQENSDKTYDKFNTNKTVVADTIRKLLAQLRVDADGKPIDKSALAQLIAPQIGMSSEAVLRDYLGGMDTPAPPLSPGSIILEKAKRALADPSAPPAAKAAAQKILDRAGVK